MSVTAINSGYMGDEIPQERERRLPTFEGQDVHEVVAKIGSVNDLDLGDDVKRIDQTLRLVVTGRICAVDHKVDEKTGNLKRVHTIKVTDAIEVPWDAISDAVLDTHG